MCAAQVTYRAKKSGFDDMINGIPIRKVYVAPIVPQNANSIVSYFQRFGEVESFRVHIKNDFQFGFIQFTSVGAAATALSKSKHRVANRRLTVKPAHDHHQPDYEEFKPPQPDSPRNIVNALNDDCLERVFMHLELLDLSAAADVCVRFQQHAVDAFKLKYKHVVKSEDYAEFNYRPAKFEMMLRNFGSLIHTINIENKILRAKAIDLLKMLNKHAPALKNLGVVGYNIAGNVNDVRPLFAKLEKLTLYDCEFTNGAEKLLAPCAELKHLRIVCVKWDNSFIDQSFPKLEDMHVNLCSAIEDTELEKFITSNPTLKTLSVGYNINLESVKIIQLFGEHLKKLEELDIGQQYPDSASQFECLSQLSALKKLTLNCSGFSITSLVDKLAENAVPLEYLSLENGSIGSDAIKSMSKLMKLNEITLDEISNLNDDHVIELAKSLPQLRALHLEESTAEHITTIGLRNMVAHAKTLSELTLERASEIEFIGMSDYRAMLKAVQDRPDKIKLEIKITGEGNKVNVPEDVMSANRDWLWIDEEVEDDDDDYTYSVGFDSDDDDVDFYDYGFNPYDSDYYGHDYFDFDFYGYNDYSDDTD